MTRRRDADAHAFNEAWENGAPAHGEVADLLQAAEILCRSAAAVPASDFRTSLREELMAEAATVLVVDPAALRPTAPGPSRPTGRGRRRAAGVTAALVSSLGAVSMVASSATAIPGDVLHPVKLGVEQVQLSFKDQGPERGSFQLERATERLAEAEALAEAGRTSEVASSLQRFNQLTGEGSTALFADFTGDGRTESVEQVNAFVADATDVLTGLEPEDPNGAYAAQWDEAARSLSSLALESSRLCARCATPDVDALVRSVAAAAQDRPLPQPEADEAPEPARSAATSAPARSTAGATPAPEPRTTSPSSGSTPRPAPSTTSPPRLSDITDPLLGPILGNDETEGLVPGLLNGLLGSPRR